MAVSKTKKPHKTEEASFRKALVSMEKRLVKKFDDGSQSLKDYVDIKVQQVQIQMDSRFEQIDGHLVQINGRFEQIDGHLVQINGRFEQIDGHLVQIDGRFEQMNRRFDKLETKIDTNTTGLVDLIERRAGEIIRLQTQVNDHEKRITILEEK